MSRFFDVDFPFESCNDCDDGQNEVDGIVIEEFACNFGSESTEIEFVSANTSTMEVETDEVILKVPIEDGNAADG